MSDAVTPTDSRTAGPTTGPRVSPGDRRQVGRLNHAIASALGRAAGTAAPNLFLTLGRHRRLFRGWLHFAGTLMPGGRLSRRESETVILDDGRDDPAADPCGRAQAARARRSNATDAPPPSGSTPTAKA